MAWPRIGDTYYQMILCAVRNSAPVETKGATEPVLASSLPELSLDHLLRMTDDTGIIQHATYSVPARRTGYCIDDNARALIVALQADRVLRSPVTRALVTNYLGYLHVSQNADGGLVNFMSYGRVLESEPPSDDCVGRAIWALGVTADLAEDEGCRLLARDMLRRALGQARKLGPRGTALAILGLVSFLSVDQAASDVRELLDHLVGKLIDRYRDHASDDWRWFEPSLTYDNAMLPLALFAAYGATGDRGSLRYARESLEFLEDVCFDGAQLQLVGNAGWHSRGAAKARADEQPIDAAAFVLAFRCAHAVTGDRHYLQRMRQSFAWFLGANRLGLPLYDFTTGGCRDGMGVSDINQNQGAESTLSFLMALLKMLELAGEGLEHADGPELVEACPRAREPRTDRAP